MLIEIAALIGVAGFGVWTIGVALDYPGVALLGGVMVVGLGATVVDSGLTYQDGHVEHLNQTSLSENETADNSTSMTNATTSVEPRYSQVPQTQNFSIGLILLLIGGLTSLQSINQFANY